MNNITIPDKIVMKTIQSIGIAHKNRDRRRLIEKYIGGFACIECEETGYMLFPHCDTCSIFKLHNQLLSNEGMKIDLKIKEGRKYKKEDVIYQFPKFISWRNVFQNKYECFLSNSQLSTDFNYTGLISTIPHDSILLKDSMLKSNEEDVYCESLSHPSVLSWIKTSSNEGQYNSKMVFDNDMKVLTIVSLTNDDIDELIVKEDNSIIKFNSFEYESHERLYLTLI